MPGVEGGARRLEKARELVASKNVKMHLFRPSGRELWTVVGSRGDLLVDASQPYCSCLHFYFAVLGGRDATCPHLVALELAKQSGSFDLVEFQDEEYAGFLRALLKDASQNL